jgi:hypothetical protein
MGKVAKMLVGGIIVLGILGGCTDTDVEEVKEENKVVQEEQQKQQEQDSIDKLEQLIEEEEQEKPKTMEEQFLEVGVPQEKVEQVIDTLKQISGNDDYIIELYDISNIHDGSGTFKVNISQGEGWLDEGISVLLTIAEGDIYLANSGDVKLYNRDNGGLIISYAETVLTDEEEANFRMYAEQVMTNMAQNPGTVKFPWLTTKNFAQRRGSEVLIQGEMSCQNGLGMTLKYLYQVKFDYYTGEVTNVAYEQIA